MSRRFNRRNVIAFLAGHALMALAIGHARLDLDDSPVAALPASDPEVRLFLRVAEPYGVLQTLLIGVEDDDLFSRGSLERLRRFAREAARVPGVAWTIAFTEVPLIAGGADRAEVADLVPSGIPDSAADLAALRKRVLGYDTVAGQLVSRDGRAALVPVRLDGRRPAAQVARDVDDLARRTLLGARVFALGAPAASLAVSVAAAGAAVPLALLIGLLLLAGLAAALRRPIPILLALGTAVLAAAVSIVPFDFLDWMPPPGSAIALVGVAIPSLLVAAFVLSAPDRGSGRSRGSGTVVQANAGFTAAAAIVAALAGDPAAGLILAVGGLVTVVVCAMVLPALAPGRPASAARQAPRRRAVAAVIASTLAVVAYVGAQRLGVSVDPASAFPPGSAPRSAEEFMNRRFGGTSTLIASIRGAAATPEALDALRAVEAAALADPAVSDVVSALVAVRAGARVDGRPSDLPPTAQAVRRFLYMAGDQPTLAHLVRRDGDGLAAYVKLVPSSGPRDAERVRDAVAAAVPPLSHYESIETAPVGARLRMEAEILARLAQRLGRLGAPREQRSATFLRGLCERVAAAAATDRDAIRRIVAGHFADGTAWVLVADRTTNEPLAVGEAEIDRIAEHLAASRPGGSGSAGAAIEAAVPAAAADPEGLDAEARQLQRALESGLSAAVGGGGRAAAAEWAGGWAGSPETAASAADIVLGAVSEIRSGGAALPSAAGVPLEVEVGGMPLAGPSVSLGVARSLALGFLVAAIAVLGFAAARFAIRGAGRRRLGALWEAVPEALVPVASVSLAFGAAGFLGLPVDPGATSLLGAALACCGSVAALLVAPWGRPYAAAASARRDGLRLAWRLVPPLAVAAGAPAMIPLLPVRTMAFILAAALAAALLLGRLHAGDRGKDCGARDPEG